MMTQEELRIRMERARIAQGLSQEALAAKAGITRQAYVNWGKPYYNQKPRGISLGLALRIMDALGFELKIVPKEAEENGNQQGAAAGGKSGAGAGRGVGAGAVRRTV